MSFDYNTSRKKLVLPEYGRNIHMMVDYVKTVEDREERTRLAHAIVAVMGNLNPHLRDINDFKHKLWDHLALIADFDLDIDYPYDPPRPESFIEKPRKVEYGTHKLRFRHYGKAIEMMIESVLEMEEGEQKDVLLNIVANHMKKSYLTWNRESVDDEVVLKDFKSITGGKVDISKIKLSEAKELISSNKPKRPQKRTFKKNN
ncbi:MAG: DUF4290 domain-containing protein [Bacteroidales bacterium]|nr:DUF4290 domain-containing protein [Bacteroidales bacterium]MBN2818121.1 DUF4290 domain-containing protein [Bacteroidales bacterium]